MNPVVSICLPTFNGAKYLRLALEDALSQSFSDFELLIRDDNSEDESFEVIQEFAAQDKRIRAELNSKRLGLFANYNACMEQARGAYIKLFAQDDRWHSSTLARCVEALKNSPTASLLTCKRKIIVSNEMLSIKPVASNPAEIFGKNSIFPSIQVRQRCLDPLENYIGEPCAVMFHSKHIGHGFDTTLHHLGDLEYWIRLLHHGDLAYIDDELVSFRMHEGSASTSNKARIWIAADIVKMSYACEQDLKAIKKSRQSFIEESLQSYSLELHNFVDTGELNVGTLRQDQSPLNRLDLESLREALFHSLLLNATLRRIVSEIDDVPVLWNEIRILKEEHKLRELMRSLPWTSTRPLRELNKLFNQFGGGLSEKQRNVKCPDDLREQQEFYIRELRINRRKILKSKSWKLWSNLRDLSRRVRRSLIAPSVSESGDKAPAIASEPQTKLHLRKYSHNLVVGAVFRNEARFLREWIEFHKLVGVEKFYLFNNQSTDEFEEVLEPYLSSGLVHLCNWALPARNLIELRDMQLSAYRRILDLVTDSAKWLAFLDLDEFLFSPYADTISEVLTEFEEFGGVSANWQMFGDSNVESLGPNDLLIERFTRRAVENHEFNLWVKSISRPEYVMRIKSPHFNSYIPGKLQVGMDKVAIEGSRSSHVFVDKLRVNHYWTRDRESFTQNKLPALRSRKTPAQLAAIEQRLLDYNAVEDTEIHRFLPALKMQMRKEAQELQYAKS